MTSGNIRENSMRSDLTSIYCWDGTEKHFQDHSISSFFHKDQKFATENRKTDLRLSNNTVHQEHCNSVKEPEQFVLL